MSASGELGRRLRRVCFPIGRMLFLSIAVVALAACSGAAPDPVGGPPTEPGRQEVGGGAPDAMSTEGVQALAGHTDGLWFSHERVGPEQTVLLAVVDEPGVRIEYSPAGRIERLVDGGWEYVAAFGTSYAGAGEGYYGFVPQDEFPIEGIALVVGDQTPGVGIVEQLRLPPLDDGEYRIVKDARGERTATFEVVAGPVEPLIGDVGPDVRVEPQAIVDPTGSVALTLGSGMGVFDGAESFAATGFTVAGPIESTQQMGEPLVASPGGSQVELDLPGQALEGGDLVQIVVQDGQESEIARAVVPVIRRPGAGPTTEPGPGDARESDDAEEPDVAEAGTVPADEAPIAPDGTIIDGQLDCLTDDRFGEGPGILGADARGSATPETALYERLRQEADDEEIRIMGEVGTVVSSNREVLRATVRQLEDGSWILSSVTGCVE
ncbi:hypothetical protein [Euzebya tangerina]|uniref:hypothetical protein n=1 Tax=Euzebya tangerina TaxID=591198 RepID=UPI0013C3717B|nr:hypothetical protein [Euzebya tangerina]